MRRGTLLSCTLTVVALLVTACAREAPRSVPEVVPPKPARRGAGWVIVYSPHPDDETIGMGQMIRRYVRTGYKVQLVLLTDGETSRAYQSYYRKYPVLWRDLDHNGIKGDIADFGLERRLEFTRAAGILGVPPERIAFYGVASGNKGGLRQDFMPLPRVEGVMRYYEELHPGALHVTVMKYTDGRPDGPGDLHRQPEHTAACDSLAELARREGERTAFYKVYVYDLPAEQRTAPIIENDPDDHDVKRRALLGGYDDVDQSGHVAIGWHSVPVLIGSVLTDTREYRVPLADVP